MLVVRTIIKCSDTGILTISTGILAIALGILTIVIRILTIFKGFLTMFKGFLTMFTGILTIFIGLVYNINNNYINNIQKTIVICEFVRGRLWLLNRLWSAQPVYSQRGSAGRARAAATTKRARACENPVRLPRFLLSLASQACSLFC